VSKGQKVYLLTDGCYSDYHVVGVYSTKQAAEEVRVLIDSEDASVAECPLDELKPIPDGFSLWRVEMGRDGTVLAAEQLAERVAERPSFGVWERYERGVPVQDSAYLQGWVLARDQEHAIKITNEKRAQIIAENNWHVGYQEPPTEEP